MLWNLTAHICDSKSFSQILRKSKKINWHYQHVVQPKETINNKRNSFWSNMSEERLNYPSYRNSQQDRTVYQNLLFHVYMKLSMFRATKHKHGIISSDTLFYLVDYLYMKDKRPATSTSNILPRGQNQRLLAQFWAPDDGRFFARNMLSFIVELHINME